MPARLEELEPRLLLTAAWTVMNYINGDNALESAAIASVNQMETVGSTSQVNLVVELARSANYDATNGNWTGARRGLITQDANTALISSTLTSLGAVDMGNAATLTSFIQWAVATYPAQHYALIIWDHGGGTNGVSWDDTANTHMSVASLATGLANSGLHLDVLGFDASMMGMAEVAYQVRSNANYLVSSEAVPWGNWPYATIATDLTSSPTQTPATLANDIVTRYGQAYSGSETLSEIDLTKVAALATQLDNLATTAQALPGSWSDISSAIQSAGYFYNPDFRDLGTFLNTLAASSTTAAVKTAAQNAATAYSAAVLSNYSGGSEVGTGLSIYLPDQGETVDSTYTSANFGLLHDTHWDEFLSSFTAGAGADADLGGQMSTATPLGALPTTVGGVIGSDGTNIVGGRDVDIYSLAAVAGKTYNFNVDAAENASPLNSYLRLFDSAGKELASNDNAADPVSGVVSSDSYLSWACSAAGTVYIAVSGYANISYNPLVTSSGVSGSTGSYTLAVSMVNGTLDTNGTIWTAVSVGSAPVNYVAAIGGEPSGARDVDMYAINVSTNQKLTIDVVSGGSGLNGYLRLFKADGTQLAFNDNTLGNDPEITYDFTGLPTGTYYIGVSGAANSAYNPKTLAGTVAGSTGSYTLTVAGAGAHLDFNGAIPTATAVASLPATLNGSIGDEPDGSMDVDMYSFTATAGQKISFNVDAASTGSTLNAVLRLFDSTGKEIDFSDNVADATTGVASADPYIEHTFATAGTYYVAVSGARNTTYSPFVESSGVPGSRGSYTLKILNIPAAAGASFVGPDAAGYIATAITPYTFQDISSTGHIGMFPGIDDNYFELGPSNTSNFTFTFYGTTYNDFCVSSNGFISLSGNNDNFCRTYTNASLTDPTVFHEYGGGDDPFNEAVISPLWDDLTLWSSNNSAVFWQVQGAVGHRQLVVQWHNNGYYDEQTNNDFVTFQVLLYEDTGNIRYDYANLGTPDYHTEAGDATVGIKGPGPQTAGGNVLQLAFDNGPTALVGSNKTILISRYLPPTVTINQSAGQADPTKTSAVNFVAKFNEPVTDFAAADVTLGGTAPGTLSAVVTGSGTTYYVAVTGMAGSGTVTATIPAGNVHNVVGQANAASTSTDNTVTYDVTAPTITGITTTTANGSYKAGTVIPIKVAFSENVTVSTAGGTPRLSLNNGASAVYASGSGTSTLTFNYTIAAGQGIAVLDHASTSALVLNGGTIMDAAKNNANPMLAAPGAAGSLSAGKTLFIDTAAPAVTVAPLVTKNNKPTLTGTVTDAAPSSGVTGVKVVVNGQTLTAVVTGTTWSAAVPTALPSGLYNVTATATDAAGNSASDATTNELLVDRAAPVVTVNSLATPNTTPTLTGTVTDASPSSGIAGVQVVVNGQSLAATVAGTTWSVAVPVALPLATYNVAATATDNVGNSASDSTTNELLVGYVDLTGVLSATWTLPTSRCSGMPVAGFASVVVSNLGNVALPLGQQINIQILARDTTQPANPDIVLTTLSNQSVSGLAPGGSASFSPYVSTATGLPADSYQILANIVPVQSLTESNTTDNTIALTATGTTQTLAVTSSFFDLAGAFGKIWTLPASIVAGTPLSGAVSVAVSNLGIVPVPAGQTVTIDFVAHDKTNSNPDVPLLTLGNQSVSALAAGGSKTFTGTVSLPAGLPADCYQILATIEPVLGESNAADNAVTVTAGRTTKTLSVIPAIVDLAGVLGTNWTLPSSVTAGRPLSGTVSVAVSNLGNVALPTGQQVTIQFLARDLTHPANPDITLATLSNQSVSGLAASGSKIFSAAISRPAGLPADRYEILATIVPVQALTESNLANNLVMLTATGLHKNILAF